MYSAFPGNYSVSYLSFVYGRSLWAELNGGENSLHWKANMLPLFIIITLILFSIRTLWLARSDKVLLHLSGVGHAVPVAGVQGVVRLFYSAQDVGGSIVGTVCKRGGPATIREN